MNLSDGQLRKLFSGIYAEACLDEKVNMRDFVVQLEDVRGQILTKGNTKCWYFIKLDKDFFSHLPNLGLLLKLQDLYYEELNRSIILHIETLLKTDPAKAWQTWLQEYADALINWCSMVYTPLCTHHFDFGDEQQQLIKSYEKLTRYILYEKWVNTLPFFEAFTKETDFTAYQLSCFNAITGQIILYWMPKTDDSLPYFEEALQLSPYSAKAMRAMGEYHLRKQDYEKARNAFLSSISAEPNDTENYCYMADSYKEEGKLAIAEQWYQDAININLLSTQSFGKLMQLYGDPDWPGEKNQQANIDELLHRCERIEIKAASENGLYNRYRDAGQSYFVKPDYENAKKYFEKAYEFRPDLPAAKLDLGYTCGYMKDFAGAQNWFMRSASAEDESLNFDTYWACAWLYEQLITEAPAKENIDKAIEYYEKCGALRGNFRDFSYNAIGILYYNAGLYNKAIGYYVKAINLNPAEPVYTDNYNDALSKLTEFADLEIDTNNPDILNSTGNFFYLKDDFAIAKQYYERALLYRKDPVFYENLGHASNKLSLFEEAEAAYKTAAGIDSPTGNSWNFLGIFYYNAYQYDKAINCYKKALEKEPPNEVYLQNLAYAYEASSLYEDAAKIYERLVDINRQNSVAWHNMALIASAQKNYEVAIPAITNALEIQPENIAYLKTAGTIYENLQTEGNPNETINADNAIKIYQKALALNDKDEYFNNRLGIVYYRSGTLDSLATSITYYKKAVEANEAAASDVHNGLNTTRAVYWQNIALAYLDLGDYNALENAIRQSLATDPDTPDNYNMAGNLYFKKEDWKKAIQMFEEAIQRDANNTIYYSNLADSYKMAGDNEKAGELYNQVAEMERNVDDVGPGSYA